MLLIIAAKNYSQCCITFVDNYSKLCIIPA
jgi:hypothetical protein